jgi:hypothetical protein
MLIAFLSVLGFTFPTPEPNAPCLDVIHQLRSEQRLEVATAQAVGNTLVYLLVDKAGNKTAQVGCTLPE